MATFEETVVYPETVRFRDYPWRYIQASNYEFRDPNTMILPGTVLDNGRLHLVVRMDKEVKIRIHSDKSGFFGWRSGISDYVENAYDAVINSGWASNPFGSNSSTLDITLRGGSMLAFVPGNEGDRGKWSASGDSFHQATVERGIEQPSDFLRDNSLLLSLTAPYSDYSTFNTHTLIFNQHFSDAWVEVLSYSDAPYGGFRTPDWIELDSAYLGPFKEESADPNSSTHTYEMGQTQDGVPWKVELSYDGELRRWFVIVDGTFGSVGYIEQSEAERIADIKVDMLNARKNIDPPTDPVIPVLPIAFGGTIVLLILITLVAVYGFSKGKGGM